MTNEELAKVIEKHECNVAVGKKDCRTCPFLYCGTCTVRAISSWVRRSLAVFDEEKKAADGILNFKCNGHSCDECAFCIDGTEFIGERDPLCMKDLLKSKIERKEKKYGDSNEDNESEGHGGSENDDK